ncbi:MAG: YkgJ family cysteine cluster protein [Candidatus Bathyarchaeaceae archaeon]
MIPIPWRYLESWNCIACGMCCKGYQVVLGFNEWINLIRTYGVGVTQPGIDKIYLGKKGDGTCLFLYKSFDTWLCGLQNMKPKACKLWPFKVLSRPEFGRPNEAVYKYGDKNFFVYVDPSCIGIRWGKPTQEFTYRTLTELIEIATGLREKQYYSTSRIPYRPQYFRVKGRKII